MFFAPGRRAYLYSKSRIIKKDLQEKECHLTKPKFTPNRLRPVNETRQGGSILLQNIFFIYYFGLQTLTQECSTEFVWLNLFVVKCKLAP
jgi:hypothetical protein